MGYRLNEPVFIAVSKPLLTEFGIHLRLESCEKYLTFYRICIISMCRIINLMFVVVWPQIFLFNIATGFLCQKGAMGWLQFMLLHLFFGGGERLFL